MNMVENDFKILNETFRERLLFKNIIAYYNCFECLHYLLIFHKLIFGLKEVNFELLMRVIQIIMPKCDIYDSIRD
jgi:hypothetical protein